MPPKNNFPRQPTILRRSPSVDRCAPMPDRHIAVPDRRATKPSHRGGFIVDRALLAPSPNEHLRQQEIAVIALLETPEALEWHNRQPVLTAMSGMAEAAVTAHEASTIHDEHLLEVGNRCLSILDRYDENIVRRHPVKPNANPWQGFEPAVEVVIGLFNRLDRTHRSSLDEAAARTSTLIKFDSLGREKSFNGFISRHICDLINPDQSPGPSAAIDRLWQQPQFLDLMGRRATQNTRNFGSATEHWAPHEQKLLTKTFRAFGFGKKQQRDLLTAWNSPREGKDVSLQEMTTLRAENLKTAFSTMANLMTVGAEVPRAVYDTFRIRNFGRYSAKALYDQHLSFKNKDWEFTPGLALSVIVSATDDRNGFIKEAIKKIEHTMSIYMEAQSLTELAGALVQTNRRFGSIDQLMVVGHGDDEGITLGHESRVTSEQLHRSSGFARLHKTKIFKPDADIILIACATDAGRDSFARIVARALKGRKLFASKSKLYPDDISPDGSDKLEQVLV